MSLKLAIAGLTATLALGAAAPALAAASSHPCFFISQWRSWKAPNADTIYLGVNQHDVYRVDLSAGSNDLTAPGVHLVSQFRGTSSVCNALDLDLKVADNFGGIVTPLIVRSITKLTPEEIAAIPPRDRP
jgi:hypothetical protein